MTGFGSARATYGPKNITVEIRSVNSKFTDVKFKLPQNYRDKEFDIKKILTDDVTRGKVEFNLSIQSNDGPAQVSINKNLFRKYYNELTLLAQELNMPTGDIMQAILRIPEVINADEQTIPDEEWELVRKTISEAVATFQNYRLAEGESIKKDLIARIDSIQQLHNKIDPFATSRIQNLRIRLKQLLDEHSLSDMVDGHRFEQEILFYMEKIDINEEKVRLTQHCKYFLQELDSDDIQVGRKLGFISQEIGREINTLGAKAYDANIQRLVVMMKDELEKIKEHVANIV
ncbi:MAG TPA: YicC family protein [Saprospiraceae bacterium]|nr:YicC family protein [Saprospiraceae bacterium]MCC6687921.1 YicC family protein [Saprospiraceae bacterium]HMX82113.1 YicC family protein [Saprospiraceae bacterium]HMX84775.1 YicC family protein [Saprospiraceae bacterium]HMZ72626.1 YicC family protein [Saprospiraceae bacterium]